VARYEIANPRRLGVTPGRSEVQRRLRA
jgi:hypothetical protein